jgi:serine kinase of HPr protein (carbohydrate metabolism regulator)
MSESVHATAVVAGEYGVLIRGLSGAGKSALALGLIERGGKLIADDRVFLSAVNGRLVASAPAATAGLVELRGRGILKRPHERSAVIRLVVDIVAAEGLERMPNEVELMTEILGINVPRQPVSSEVQSAFRLVEAALAALSPQRNMSLRPMRLW